MKHTYNITGMTCNNCVTGVTDLLSNINGVNHVEVNLENAEASITTSKKIPIDKLKDALPDKYAISEQLKDSEIVVNNKKAKSKIEQLQPLFLIFTYLIGASLLLNYKAWNAEEAMLDFMGLFYIVFSFFKFLDLKGFPESFKMYDPLAKIIPAYGWLYPFIELGLGILFLMRIQTTWALGITIFILGITTFGVIKTLLDKKSIRCACLGTALKLPMTEATVIENTIMLIMAISMLRIQFM